MFTKPDLLLESHEVRLLTIQLDINPMKNQNINPMKKWTYSLAMISTLVLCGSASAALTVNDTQIWVGQNGVAPATPGQISLNAAPIGGYLEIGPLGNLTTVNSGSSSKNGRVNMNSGDTFVINGGSFSSMVDFKFPDSNPAASAIRLTINSGSFYANKFQMLNTTQSTWDTSDVLITLGLNATLTLGSGGFATNSLYSAQYDPIQWEARGKLVAAPGYSLAYEDLGAPVSGGYNMLGSHQIKVTVVPEPSTLALLGLGGLALIRRRK